jgi:isovaleryl-CoA dehydrogenase
MAATRSFALSADDRAVLEAADKFARKEFVPLARRMDDEEWWPSDIFQKIGAAGFMGATVPAEHGGAGMDLFSSGLICQAFARWNPAIALSWAAHDNLCVNNISRNANDAQRRQYLPDLCNGTKIGALGLTEPGAGSDALGAMRTSARREGDHYILNGTKIYITNGPVADVLLVYAKTTPELGAKGISAFIVEKNFPGFKVAQKLIKMGFRGSQTGELVFGSCDGRAARAAAHDGRAKPHNRRPHVSIGAGDAPVDGQRVRSDSAPGRTAKTHGRLSVGRRAADAGDRARNHGRPQTHADRRAVTRAGAAHGRGSLQRAAPPA